MNWGKRTYKGTSCVTGNYTLATAHSQKMYPAEAEKVVGSHCLQDVEAALGRASQGQALLSLVVLDLDWVSLFREPFFWMGLKGSQKETPPSVTIHRALPY